MRSILYLAFSLLFTLNTAVCQNRSSIIKPSDLRLKIDSVISLHKDFNGVILVSKHGENLYTSATGFSAIEKHQKLKLADQFVIGSISKQITAVLVLRAAEKGLLKLDIPIAEYLKGLNQPWKDSVTVHHLLTHTHGILALNEPLEFSVGTAFHYSQLGYQMLANILKEVTSCSFKQLSTDLFKEFHLENTFHPENKGYLNLVKGYVAQEDGSISYETNSLMNYVPAGSFISNAHDLVSWNQLLYSGALVNKQSLALMKTRFATREHPIFDKIEYGYGLLFRLEEQNLEIGALGYAPGFVSANYYYPKTQTSVVVLENVAKNLNDFKKTFQVHLAIMHLLKSEQ